MGAFNQEDAFRATRKINSIEARPDADQRDYELIIVAQALGLSDDAVTTDDIAELTATTVVALFMLCCRFAQLETVEKQCGGESVSQSPLKDNEFSTFVGRNPRFELRPKTGVSPYFFVESIVARPNPVVPGCQSVDPSRTDT
jgi:hypothetical protein